MTSKYRTELAADNIAGTFAADKFIVINKVRQN